MPDSRKSLVELAEELRLKEELDRKYCDENGSMIYEKSLTNLDQNRDSWYREITERLSCQKSELDADVFNSRKTTKDVLSEWLL